MPLPVLAYIAKTVTHNGRDLEGGRIRGVAQALRQSLGRRAEDLVARSLAADACDGGKVDVNVNATMTAFALHHSTPSRSS